MEDYNELFQYFIDMDTDTQTAGRLADIVLELGIEQVSSLLDYIIDDENLYNELIEFGIDPLSADRLSEAIMRAGGIDNVICMLQNY